MELWHCKMIENRDIYICKTMCLNYTTEILYIGLKTINRIITKYDMIQYAYYMQ